ncbi:Adhesion G-protein coupled receptor G5 [Apodemus speciosus]|uniref:Adhesion G-protein coupled receptor G5 n=1 Tax=Apodemus speciosus TaxID=105296 RepID=A0ABQ0F360_APOSI
MKQLEQPLGRSLSSRVRHIHHLEETLLNASFHGHNLTLQTKSIQSMVFKLSCDFPGLSLTSATLTNVSQAWAPHAMQFPADLTEGACVTSRPAELRLVCIYFFTADLFQDDRNSYLLNNYVLGAQLDHRPVNNLQKPVNISFWHNRSLEGYTVTCVFWKEGAGNRSWGAWSFEGCHTEQPSPTQVLCHCNHLTYFAVLMQFSGDPVPAELQVPLEYISLVGCSISIVASLFTIVLYAHSRKQSDSTTRIHMNLHGSVLLLNATFLLSSRMALPTEPRPVCTVLAAALHYGLLSSLTWMAIEGFNLYLLLGHVYNVYIRRYLLKLCVLGWGCWVCSPTVHGILVMGYGGLTSLFNLVVLAWALWLLCRLRAREKVLSPWTYRDTVTVLGLTVLLGTTWALAFFSFSVFLLPQLFLFTIFNSLYGFFLFLWFCSQKRRSDAEAKAGMEAVSASQTTH